MAASSVRFPAFTAARERIAFENQGLRRVSTRWRESTAIGAHR